MKIFDGHCHLQDERLKDSLAEDLANARKIGVYKFACCGVAPNDWQDVLHLAKENADVIPSFGLHPWEVKERVPDWLEKLRYYLLQIPSGVGEIGLDHGIRERNDKEQEEVFLAQLDLAKELHRPVSIHCRRAFQPLIRLLSKYGPPRAGFLVHSFSGNSDDMTALVELGAYFSFSGTCTFTRNKKAHRNIKAAPLARLLVETDAPDMYPLIRDEEPLQQGEKRTNRPANIFHPLRKIAELRELNVEEMAKEIWQNGIRLFAPVLETDNEQI